MTFRARLTLAAAAAVAVAVLLATGVGFFALRRGLVHSVDETLRSRVNAVARLARQGELAEGAEGRDELARFGGLAQIASPDGSASVTGSLAWSLLRWRTGCLSLRRTGGGSEDTCPTRTVDAGPSEFAIARLTQWSLRPHPAGLVRQRSGSL